MSQTYHSNAATNVHTRLQIRNSSETNIALSARFGISQATVSKWKNRDFEQDKSSRPKHIEYALTAVERAIIINIRKTTWLPLDEVFEMMIVVNPSISRSAIYRAFLDENINRVPQEKKEEAKKFKEYKPGFLHIDVTYLPTIKGKKSYLFVAIDRATRLMYYCEYEQKTAENAEDFMQKCIDFFPFFITHVLTDNGLEFTNYLIKSKTGNLCQKPSKLDNCCAEHGIQHRLTKPATPKTNGMVERANGTIKNGTILIHKYENNNELAIDLAKFLMFYNLYRRHGSLRKELNVKTPFDAVEKWFQLQPDLFKEKPIIFKNKLITLLNKIIENH